MFCNRNKLPGIFEVIRIRRNHPGGTMNICKRTIIMAAWAAVAALTVAGPASASTATQSVRSFYFSRQGDDDRPYPGLRQRRRLGHRHGAAHRDGQRRGTGAAVPLRPGAIRVLLVRVLRQHRAQRVHRAPVLLRTVLHYGQLAEAVLPDRYQVQPVADHRLPGHLRRLDQVRAAALDRLVHERARQPALGREHHRLLAARKPR